MSRRKMTENLFFRIVKCGLTKEQTAELCFKSVRTVTMWDNGKPIPKEYRRLMKLKARRELSDHDQWEGFVMHHDKLELPTGQLVAPQQIIAAIALLELCEPSSQPTVSKLLRMARAIAKIKVSC